MTDVLRKPAYYVKVKPASPPSRLGGFKEAKRRLEAYLADGTYQSGAHMWSAVKALEHLKKLIGEKG